MSKPPPQQTKAQRDATLASVTKGPAGQAQSANHLKKMGSGRKGSKQGK